MEQKHSHNEEHEHSEHKHVHDETCNHENEHEHESHAMQQMQQAPTAPTQNEQEKYLRLSILEQQARQIQQQLEMIDQQMIELQMLKMQLDDLKEAEPKSEMLSSIGKNIFIQTSLQSKDLLVDIGARTVVKKSIDETKALIDKDITSLTESRAKVMDELNQVAFALQSE